MEISVNINNPDAWQQGRNGLAQLKQLLITVLDSGIVIDGINSQGNITNGGFGGIPEADFTELCRAWLALVEERES